MNDDIVPIEVARLLEEIVNLPAWKYVLLQRLVGERLDCEDEDDA